jgi:hypothetical protein
MPQMDQVSVANQDYQQNLAELLIGIMGLECAMQTCLENGWDGALQRVLRSRDKIDMRGGAGCGRRSLRSLEPAGAVPVARPGGDRNRKAGSKDGDGR